MAAIRALALPSARLALTMTEQETRSRKRRERTASSPRRRRGFSPISPIRRTVNSARDDAWKTPLWQALSDAGLTLAWVPEEQGGAGAEIADGFAVLGVAGRSAVAIPLAETLLAGWLLSRAGLTAPQGAMSVAPARPGDTHHAECRRNAERPRARRAVRPRGEASRGAGRRGSVALVETAACRLAEGISLAGEPHNTVTFDRVTPRQRSRPPDIDQTALMLMGCVVRAVETAGALRGDPRHDGALCQ